MNNAGDPFESAIGRPKCGVCGSAALSAYKADERSLTTPYDGVLQGVFCAEHAYMEILKLRRFA